MTVAKGRKYHSLEGNHGMTVPEGRPNLAQRFSAGCAQLETKSRRDDRSNRGLQSEQNTAHYFFPNHSSNHRNIRNV